VAGLDEQSLADWVRDDRDVPRIEQRARAVPTEEAVLVVAVCGQPRILSFGKTGAAPLSVRRSLRNWWRDEWDCCESDLFMAN
jgi:hypothetical protein